MKGNEVTELRENLSLNKTQFAQVFGLGMSAAYRWEAQGRKVVKVDPMAAAIFAVLQSAVRKLGKNKLGEMLAKALEHEHELFALWKVLGTLFDGGRAKADGGKAKKQTAPKAKAETKTAKGAAPVSASAKKPRSAKRVEAKRVKGAKTAKAIGLTKDANGADVSGPIDPATI